MPPAFPARNNKIWGEIWDRAPAEAWCGKDGEKVKKVLDKTGPVWYYSGALLRAPGIADVSHEDLEKR